MVKQLLTKFALLAVMLVGVGSAWAEETYSLTPDKASTGSSATTYITTLTGFTHNSISWKMNQWNPSTLQIKTNQSSATSEFRFFNTSAFPGRITKVVITFSALTVSDASKLMFLGGTSEVDETSGGTAGTWNSTNKTLTWTPGASDNFTYFAFYQNGKAASGTNYLASSDAIVVTYENGGSNLTNSDLAITGAPVALSFDLYNNSAAQAVNYTTSSTGAITVSGGEGYVTTSVNESTKTISVTPVATTTTPQTITVNQAADDTYSAGSVTFTVAVDDSTPFAGGDITFDAALDKGTNDSGSGSITKQVVTLSGSNCNLSNGVAYRLYSGSTTTFSTTQGKITKIVFTMNGSYSSSLLSTTKGSYDEGTWTGSETSVAFSASAQARVEKIIVTVSTKESVATINGISPTNIGINASGSFTYDIDYAAGLSASDATITWTSDNAVLTNDNGSYRTGGTEGTANVTVTVTPNDATTYDAVSATFPVSITDSRTAIATINGISPLSIKTGNTGTFTSNIDFATGTTSSDYTITFESADNNILNVQSNGQYNAGDNEESVNVTVTVTPTDNTVYKAVTATYSVSVYAPVVFVEFYESFDNCEGNGGNDGTWTNSQKDLNFDNSDWTFGSSSSAYMCAKLGSGSRAATATTPALKLDNENTYVLTFKAAAWPGAETTMNLSSDDAIFNGNKETSVTMADSRWTSYYLELTDGTATTQVNFRSNGRIFFDEVRVMEKSAYEALSASKAVESYGWATYIPDYAVEFESGDAWVITNASVSDGLTLEEVTKVPAKTPVLLKGAGAKTITISSDANVAAPATNLLMISNGSALASGSYPYVLAKDGTGAAFKQWTGEVSVLKDRVVLLLDEAVSAARSIFMLDCETTGIASVKVSQSKEQVYDLQGRRVAQPTKGLYIVNGKKMILK